LNVHFFKDCQKSEEERSFADMLVGSMWGACDTDRQGDVWLDAGVDPPALFADNARGA